MDKNNKEEMDRWIKSFLDDLGFYKGGVGLRNLGNTCYMNATLQSFLSNPELVAYFMCDFWDDDANKIKDIGVDKARKVANAFKDLISEYYDAIRKNIDDDGKLKLGVFITPNDFKKKCGVFNPIFSGTGQQDATEAIITLFSAVTKSIGDFESTLKPDNIKESEVLKWREDTFSKELKNPFEKLFRHCDFSRLKHKSCGNVSTALPSGSNCFTLNIPAKTNDLDIKKCLAKSMENEIVDNETVCNACKKGGQFEKQIGFYKLPNYLMLSPLRFDVSVFPVTKNDNKIGFELDNFSLDDYVLDDKFKGVKYELTGIVCHGGNYCGGHYWAYCKRGDKWFLCNDSTAKEVNIDEVNGSIDTGLWVTGPTNTKKNGYVFLYKRKDMDRTKIFEGYDVVGRIKAKNEKAWKDFDDWKNDLCNMDPECKVIFDNKDKEINELAEKKDKEVVIQKINKLRKDIEANQKIKEQNKIRNKAENQKALDTFVKEISAKFPETLKDNNIKSKIDAMKQPAKLELSTEEYAQEIDNIVKVEINKIVNKKVADEFDAYKKKYDENFKLIDGIKANQAYKNIPIPKISNAGLNELKKIVDSINSKENMEKLKPAGYNPDPKKKTELERTFDRLNDEATSNDDKKGKLRVILDKFRKNNLTLIDFKKALSELDFYLNKEESVIRRKILDKMKAGDGYQALVKFDTNKFEIESKDFNKKMTAFKNYLESLKKKAENKDSKVVIEEIEKLESYKKLLSVDEKGLTKELLISFFKDFDRLCEKYKAVPDKINEVCKNMHYEDLKDKDNGLKMDPEDFKNAIDGLKGRINRFLNEPLLNNMKGNKKYINVLDKFPDSIKDLSDCLIKTETEFNKDLFDLEKKLDNAVENLKLATGDLETSHKDEKYENVVNHEIPKKKYDELFSEENLGKSTDEYKKLVEDYKNILENLRFVNDDLEKARKKEEYKNHLDKLKEQYDRLLTEENLGKNPDEYKKLVEDYKVDLWIEYIVSVTMSEERKKFNSELIKFLSDDEEKDFLTKLTSNENELRKFLKDKPEIRAEFEAMQKIGISKEQKNEIEKKLGLKTGELENKSPSEILNLVGKKMENFEARSKVFTKITVIFGSAGLISTSGLLVAMFLIPIPPIQIALIVAGSATGVFAIEEGVRKKINHSNYKKAKGILDGQAAKTKPLLEKAQKSGLTNKTETNKGPN